MPFRNDFLWGTATASYQIEGAVYEDGKGLSTWDEFCKLPGAVFEGHSGDVACDHYHRWQEDIGLIKALGTKAYRFSLSWPRIFPSGTGSVNQKGVDFYNKLIDGLLAAGITPFMTLFHWDYPMDLYNRGEWLNPASSDWFADYATFVGKTFGDRVKNFMPLNEPQVFIGRGHFYGNHAPGKQLKMPELLRMIHNTLLANGKAVRALRSTAKDCKIGSALAPGKLYIPATDSAADVDAARKATFALDKEDFVMSMPCWADPMFLGRYPDGMEEAFSYKLKIGPDDMKIISTPMDFHGQNMYSSELVRSDGKGGVEKINHPVGNRKTACNWHRTPTIMYYGLKFLYERYKLPIYITENGLSCTDGVSADGKVHDPDRIDFLNSYLFNVRRAAEDGVDIRGYFQWSLLDNFEWARGYNERFGLIHVDYQTQKRIPKDSAAWYGEVIKTNGANLIPV